MPRRIIEVDGQPWEVEVSGRVTQYTKDEFGLVFSRGTGPDREQRGRDLPPVVQRPGVVLGEPQRAANRAPIHPLQIHLVLDGEPGVRALDGLELLGHAERPFDVGRPISRPDGP